MNNIKDYGNDFWERFFEFVVPDESTLSRQEVQSELQKLGIDVRPAWDRIQRALDHPKEAERARSKLESARRKRPSALAKIRDHQVPSIPDIRDVKKWIEDRLGAPTKTAYCRKLERVSDEDLKTLLEDWSLLEEFSKDSTNVEP